MYPDARDEVVQLYLDDIIPNRFQPREVFDEKALKELAVSIKEHGVIQPIIVRNVNGKYEIIAGERRYKASALAGLTKIPAIIRDLDDKESSKVALLENLQRKNLNPIEEARTYQKILEIDEMTQEELAKTMGKSQSAVANKLRLLSLPEDVQESLLKEQISERHARTLLNIPDTKKQKEMLKRIIDEKMSVRNLEEEIRKMYPKEENTNQPTASTDVSNSSESTIASTQAFVNSNPLTPTAEIPEDKSNYGKVTIAPPEGEVINQKFINVDGFNQGNSEPQNSNDTPSVNQTEKSSNGSELDSFLNIQSKDTTPEPKFITPAEKIVKTEQAQETSSDYFKIPDFSAIELPTSVVVGTEENSSNQTYSIEEATNKIRELTAELKNHGIKIDVDEMNFEKNYQIIIKIEK